MNKKIKIIIASIVAVAIIVAGVVVYSNKSKNVVDNTNNQVTTEGNENITDMEDPDFVQPEAQPPSGESYDVFKGEIESTGFTPVDEENFKYTDGDKLLAELNVNDAGVTYKISNSSDGLNEALKQTFIKLFPNNSDELFNLITGEKISQTVSLDNRTVSIDFTEEYTLVSIM